MNPSYSTSFAARVGCGATEAGAGGGAGWETATGGWFGLAAACCAGGVTLTPLGSLPRDITRARTATTITIPTSTMKPRKMIRYNSPALSLADSKGVSGSASCQRSAMNDRPAVGVNIPALLLSLCYGATV